VDFVILRAEDLALLGVVELDDRSHERQSRADRDGLVDDALAQAGIRVCRIKARREYNLETLCGQLNDAFAGQASAEAGV
jgi:very-short-patch-repair endonuclease